MRRSARSSTGRSPVLASAAAWSSSTPPPWPTRRSTSPRAALAEGGPVAAVGVTNQRLDHRLGPGDRRARRPRPRLAGPAHGRRLPRLAGRGLRFAERVGHQGAAPARPGRPRPRRRPVRRHRRRLGGVAPVGRRCPRHRRAPTPPSPGSSTATTPAGTPRCSTRCGSRRRPCRPSSTRAGSSAGDRPRRVAAHRRPRRRPAGVAPRPGLRPPGHGQDHVRHRRHARRLRRARTRRSFDRQGPAGTFPIIAWRRGGETDVGRRGDHAGRGHQRRVAARRPRHHRHGRASRTTSPPSARRPTASCTCPPSGPGHAPMGLRRPRDLLGITRGTGRPQVVRAVLEGVAQRGADLVEAAEADTGLALDRLRVDGGMTGNPTFVQAAGRRHRPAGRGLPRARGDDARCRLPRRPRRGHVGRAGTTSPRRGARRRWSSRPGPRPRPLARGCRPGRPLGARPQRHQLLSAAHLEKTWQVHDDARSGSSRASPSSWWRRPGSPGGGSSSATTTRPRPTSTPRAHPRRAGRRTSGDASGGIEGAWTVDTSVGSFDDFSGTWAGYRFDEELASIGTNTAVGRTPDVTGTMTVAGDEVTAVDVEVDLTTLQSDSGTRRRAAVGGLESDPFPTATFADRAAGAAGRGRTAASGSRPRPPATSPSTA